MANALHRLPPSSMKGIQTTGSPADGTEMGAQADPKAIRVYLIDDHQIVRRGIRELLSTVDDMEVVGEAANGEEARPHLARVRPDVAIIDMHLGRGERSGIEVCGEIHSSLPEVACLMLTSIADVGACTAAVVSGASGYLLKQIRGSELVDSVRLVAAGSTVVPSLLVAEVIGRLRSEGNSHLGELTAKEWKLLDLITAGRTPQEIGDELDIATEVVQSTVLDLLTELTKHSAPSMSLRGRRVRPLPWNV